MSKASRLACLVIAACVVWSATRAEAGPLASDGNAAVHGTSAPLFFSINVGTTFLISANVDYGVYAPGKFDLSFGAGADPSGGTQFVYAYQVFNTGANDVNTVANPISIFTEGLGPNADAQNIEALPLIHGNYGQLPDSASFAGTTSARWDYTNNPLPIAGGTSQILLFTSPHGPSLQPGSIQGGGLGASQPLPSPVPEPSTVALMGLGVFFLAGVQLRKRYR